MDSRFSSENRLLTPAQYQAVFNSAQRSSDRNFLVLAKENRLAVARLGLAISKKRVPRAVDRNRIRRLIRESFRNSKANLSGMDIVVLAQKDIDFKNGDNIHKSLLHHWHRLAKCEKSSSPC